MATIIHLERRRGNGEASVCAIDRNQRGGQRVNKRIDDDDDDDSVANGPSGVSNPPNSTETTKLRPENATVVFDGFSKVDITDKSQSDPGSRYQIFFIVLYLRNVRVLRPPRGISHEVSRAHLGLVHTEKCGPLPPVETAIADRERNRNRLCDGSIAVLERVTNRNRGVVSAVRYDF
ncbi:hypothetical protein EAI_05240 [Harpegnathos saltator]|uniref:Uncharacterized protein n=1 Tax=Harpegnathos saltator TaxID=610380 RepID=E2C9S5_HARSA|nr:hypothetical protein EAI_05240 [Harpegnathos saltator]